MPTHPHKLCLQKGEVVHADEIPDAIVCARGKLWITQTGLARDVLLRDGESYQPRSGGLVVIEALEASCLASERRRDSGPNPRPLPFHSKLKINHSSP